MHSWLTEKHSWDNSEDSQQCKREERFDRWDGRCLNNHKWLSANSEPFTSRQLASTKPCKVHSVDSHTSPQKLELITSPCGKNYNSVYVLTVRLLLDTLGLTNPRQHEACVAWHLAGYRGLYNYRVSVTPTYQQQPLTKDEWLQWITNFLLDLPPLFTLTHYPRPILGNPFTCT